METSKNNPDPIFVPAYFLRFLPVIGPELAWYYLAFRQAMYANGVYEGRSSANLHTPYIADLLGISVDSLLDFIYSEEPWCKLEGLVWRIENGQGIVTLHFLVQVSLPLVSPDAFAMGYRLSGGHATTASSVAAACSRAPIDDLLADADDLADPDAMVYHSHETIGDVLRGFGEFTEAQISKLDALLTARIMPENEFLCLPLEYLGNLRNTLGDGQVWLLAILDYTSQDNRVTVEGGYEEMARWLGLSNPELIYQWLNSPAMQSYVQVVDSENVGQWDSPRTFTILRATIQ